MAERRPIITIEVDDTEFKRFKREFDAFKNGGGIMRLGVAGAGMFRSSDIPGVGLARAMETLGERILRLTSTISGFGLRLAAGGIFGIGALGFSAFSRYREATGLGVTPGQLSAFSAYYSPLVNGGDVLSRVANARNDLALRPYLARLGIGPQQLQSQSNDQIAASIVERAAALWKNGPQTQQFADAMGMTQFFTMEDLRRMGQMTPDQLRRMHGQMNAAEGQLNFSPEIAQQWNDLTVQLRKAGVQIDTVLIRDLSRLAEPLGHLSDVIVTTLDSFLNNADMPQAIGQLGKGIEWLASEIQSGDFQNGVKSFAQNIVAAAEGVANFMHAIGMSPSTMPSNTAADLSKRMASGDTSRNKFYAYEAWAHDKFSSEAAENYASHVREITSVEKSMGLPAGSMFGIWGAESSFSQNTRESSAGALGPFQLMPQIYHAANIDPNDFSEALKRDAKDFNIYMQKYGDEDKALAAVNWGPANLDKEIAKYGNDWEAHLNDETRNYISRVHAYQSHAAEQLNRPPTNPYVSLNVHNSTSANIATTAAGLSH